MRCGREAELRVAADLIGGLARGAGGALIISGEAGIGKSALLAAAAELATASGTRVLSATGGRGRGEAPVRGAAPAPAATAAAGRATASQAAGGAPVRVRHGRP
jgi:hypothetical protein